MTPAEQYARDLEKPGFRHDPAQQRAVTELDRIFHALHDIQRRSGLARWFSRGPDSVKGLYMWGGVGRGKTYLMDQFYDCLEPSVSKRRAHFHRFMEDVHSRLRRLGKQQDPLREIGRRLAEKHRVLCFDEFFVVDIADAMILSELFASLFHHGVTLIATSNVQPDDLYKDGLQRAKFLPTIELLKKYCRVLDVDGGEDHRLRILSRAETYHFPLDNDDFLADTMRRVSPGRINEARTIRVNQRPMKSRAVADGVGWFTFETLCAEARAPADYIELARRFNTVLIENVPQMDDDDNNAARRFIHLIDELYDRRVNAVMTAAVRVDDLYIGDRLQFEFQRTISRLTEMQTREYLAQAHRP